MIQAKIVGATGYGGLSAIEILSNHPEVELVSISATQDIGHPIKSFYPHLKGICDLVIDSPDNDQSCDVVFFATPDGVGMKQANKYHKSGIKIVDYSGDFRFNTEALYTEYASRIGKSTEHANVELLQQSVYGLPELHRAEIAKAPVVGNCGCFAISSILGIAPALKDYLVDYNTIIFDAKTGISGAGKKASDAYHYPHRYEQMNAYKIANHQHVMEIECQIETIIKKRVPITFTAQVLPIVRGIMTTIYAKLNDHVDYDKLFEAYKEFYKDDYFVDIYGMSDNVGSRHVRGSNKCALWVNVDKRTNTMIVVSHIDNLMKGQAANAIQNMNIMFGLEETMGLRFTPSYP